MEHTEGTFKGYGGIELYYQRWRPGGAPRAILAIVHGVGEHSGRYMNVVNCLVPDGFTIYGFDLRGHGRSPGQRGYINRFAEFREDVRAYLQFVAQQEAGRPVFLYGHSLGGLIVLDYVEHYPEGLKGVIASGPAIGKLGISPFLFAIARVLSVVAPRFSLKTGLDDEGLSRDAKVVQAYISDPLVHDLGTARLGTEVPAAAAYVNAHAADIRLPLLIVHGGADRLSLPEGSRAFFDKVSFADKQRIEYPGGYHEPHNDLDSQKAIADIEKWIEAHIQAGEKMGQANSAPQSNV